ncbi:MAG: zf-HC2 domain-containing protein, partial [Planctomycetales bacterium]|nr:zf-HC2 domain-containing protein [Planctomycetales bacterium]
MSDGANNSFMSLVDAYLDGALAPDQRRAFEMELKSDQHLAQQVELQRRINRSLQRRFVVPPIPLLNLPTDLIDQHGGDGSHTHDQHSQSGDSSARNTESTDAGRNGTDSHSSQHASQNGQARNGHSQQQNGTAKTVNGQSNAKRSAAGRSKQNRPPQAPRSMTDGITWLQQAVLALGGVAVLALIVQCWPSGRPSEFDPQPLTDVYQQQVDGGYTPELPYTDDDELLTRMYKMRTEG